MKADEKQELLRAVAKAKGVSVQQLHKQMAERYAEAYALEVMGAEGVEAALKPLRQRQQEQQARKQRDNAIRREVARGEKTRQQIAAEFGVSGGLISQVTGSLRDNEANSRAREIARQQPKNLIQALQDSGDTRHAGKLKHVASSIKNGKLTQQVEKQVEREKWEAEKLAWARKVGSKRDATSARPTQGGKPAE